MHASLIRRQLGGLVPPKVAAPTLLVSSWCMMRTSDTCYLACLGAQEDTWTDTRALFLQSSGQGAGLAPLVNFYSKLPKGAAPAVQGGGIKERFFNGKNASASPLLATILAIFGLGYTIDYQSSSIFSSGMKYMLTVTSSFSSSVVRRYSALEYVNITAPLCDHQLTCEL
jgi:F-type H+-transporting ATPase subunit f